MHDLLEGASGERMPLDAYRQDFDRHLWVDSITDDHRKIAECGFRIRRVRVVEEPITRYLLWEPHVMRLRDEQFEMHDPLPEIRS
ncbi:MAG TPA: hypothetical protein VFX16_24695 [Pseudonocardiaceae bacterium]|nr:hypothetical protein [Pseudonocardiaceae bacterium]